MRSGQIHFCSLEIRRQEGTSGVPEELRVGHRIRAAHLQDKTPPHNKIPVPSVTFSLALCLVTVLLGLSVRVGRGGGGPGGQRRGRRQILR